MRKHSRCVLFIFIVSIWGSIKGFFTGCDSQAAEATESPMHDACGYCDIQIKFQGKLLAFLINWRKSIRDQHSLGLICKMSTVSWEIWGYESTVTYLQLYQIRVRSLLRSFRLTGPQKLDEYWHVWLGLLSEWSTVSYNVSVILGDRWQICKRKKTKRMTQTQSGKTMGEKSS